MVAVTVRIVKSRSNSGKNNSWGDGNGTDNSINKGGENSADSSSGSWSGKARCDSNVVFLVVVLV